jgi:hypothetical protein
MMRPAGSLINHDCRELTPAALTMDDNYLISHAV